MVGDSMCKGFVGDLGRVFLRSCREVSEFSERERGV